MLKTAMKELAGSLGYDVIRRNGGGGARLTRGIVARFEVQEHPLAFLVLDEWDYIQKHHLHGRFYEAEELDLIGRHLAGGTFVDVGANVGNHTVYVLKLLAAERVIAFEPNPAAAELLAVNVALNGLCGRVDLRRTGLGAERTTARLVAPGHKDLGSTRLAVGAAGTGAAACTVVTGDEALAGVPEVAMIKIDTEAMELDVLRGLQATIARCRPKLFVEIDDANRGAVLGFAEALGYGVAATHRRYDTNCNYLLVPEA